MFSDFLNLFVWDFKHNLGTVIRALQTKGLFQSLAEPNLVAESGKELSRRRERLNHSDVVFGQHARQTLVMYGPRFERAKGSVREGRRRRSGERHLAMLRDDLGELQAAVHRAGRLRAHRFGGEKQDRSSPRSHGCGIIRP